MGIVESKLDPVKIGVQGGDQTFELQHISECDLIDKALR